MAVLKKLLIILSVCLVIASGVLFLVFEKEEIKNSTFSISYNGQTISSGERVNYGSGKTQFLVKNSEGFTVKVIPNVSNDFDFYVGELLHNFSEIEDLTSAFDIEITSDGFTLDSQENFKISKVLEKIYPGEEISFPEGFSKQGEFFIVQVIDLTTNTTINFKLNWFRLVLDQTEIII